VPLPDLRKREDKEPSPSETRRRRLYRHRAELSERELARRMGITRSLLRDFEHGVKEFDDEQYTRWMRELALADSMNASKGSEAAYRAENDKLREENGELREENSSLKSQLMNSEMISTMRYEQIRELAERLERLQSPLVKGNKD
jgi:transcriptional regulator with XRE-family HTH domain